MTFNIEIYVILCVEIEVILFYLFYNNRKQYVHINGTNSDVKLLKYGVSQRSILGRLFFIVYINDLPGSYKLAKFIVYADE